MTIAAIILAAGKGTRMESELPKVLHPVAGAPLLAHVLATAAEIEAERCVVVVGHGAEQTAAAAQTYAPDVLIAEQTEQKGTGHAVQAAQDALEGFAGDVVILYGDTPFTTAETLQKMLEKRAQGNAVVVLGFHAAAPGRYGRLMVDDDGRLDAIIEAKDCTEAQLMVDFCNSGVLCAPAELLFSLLDDVDDNNASGEFYLTDVVALARGRGLACAAISCDEAETLGVNSRADLAAAEAAFQRRARAAAMANGATLIDPETVYFSRDTMLGRDVLIEPNVFFGPEVTVESGATIKAFCHLEGCHISEGCQVGPFARLRPGAELGGNVRIGNFVEVKNAQLDPGAKANHLAYIGDGSVGKDANIGAGTIFCNYDGVMKHRTEIGERAFIGSNSALVAPVRIGDAAVIGSGSVITGDVPDGALAISRAKQANKPGLGIRLMDRLRAIKAARK